MALLLPASQAEENPSDQSVEDNGTAAFDAAADEKAIRGQVDQNFINCFTIRFHRYKIWLWDLL